MDFYKVKQVAIPQNPVPEFDLTAVFKTIGYIVGSLIGLFKFVDAYYAHKKHQNEEFIERVVASSMRAILDSILGDLNDKVTTLFNYREQDRAHYDSKFDSIMKEIRK